MPVPDEPARDAPFLDVAVMIFVRALMPRQHLAVSSRLDDVVLYREDQAEEKRRAHERPGLALDLRHARASQPAEEATHRPARGRARTDRSAYGSAHYLFHQRSREEERQRQAALTASSKRFL
eukprot:31245-Pelagococcus_subviridis.AAC.5